jgi:excisionase family DNA binding protein
VETELDCPTTAPQRPGLGCTALPADDVRVHEDDQALPVELTTNQAARLLGVSPAWVTRLADRGELPYRFASEESRHRRFLLDEVLEYRERRQAMQL